MSDGFCSQNDLLCHIKRGNFLFSEEALFTAYDYKVFDLINKL